ncbi:MAG: 3-isopropylmalate dehydrogenase [Actinomycetota bacterium]
MASAARYRIGVIPGDGTGPEVVAEGLKVLEAVLPGATAITIYDWGGERYLATGETLPDSALEDLGHLDAIYLGAIGHPGVPSGVLERGILLRIRFGLDQYVNLRPVRLYEGVQARVRGVEASDVDLVVVRENVEGLYAGSGRFERKGTADEVAVQESVNTRGGVERVVRYAFDLALKRRGHVDLVHKTNVLNYSGDLWQRVVDEVAHDFSDVETGYLHVDAFCVLALEDPSRFDVVVTDNMFGDIITDLAAVLQGGLGVACGGNVNPQGVSMFEPIGGTAPQWTGTGGINPIAAIGAVGMLLENLGEREAARRVEAGIRLAVSKMASQTAGEMGFSTSEVGDLVVEGARNA